MTTENIIGVMFLSREVAHREHLKTTSYAAHQALGSFYGEIVDLADHLAEACQGRHGKVLSIPFLDPNGEKNIADELESHMQMIEKDRYKAVDKDDSPLQNLIDEVLSLYLTTLYKLRRFK